ncbi:hypothetical protein T439DRAFT_328109 [Meredithblackwellia eburnea MCA 4105]
MAGIEEAQLDLDEPERHQACLSCRALKRRCFNDGDGSICRRCKDAELECTYHQSKRGPKAGAPQRRKRPRLGVSLEDGDKSKKLARNDSWTLKKLPLHLPQIPSDVRPPKIPSPLSATIIPPKDENDTSSHSGSSPDGSFAVRNPHPTGNFGLNKLLDANHGQAEISRISLADAFVPVADKKEVGSFTTEEEQFKNIVEVGILPDNHVQPLFDYYFAHLNAMPSLLDPALHTASYCRVRSPFLFTAILTVTLRVTLPNLYPASLTMSRIMISKGMAAGISNLEFFQAIAILVFWQEATDNSGPKKIAYVIRGSFELGLHKARKRPLPECEREKRKVLDGERFWIYLTLADYRISLHRGLPRMIDDKYRHDALSWYFEHDGPTFCPQEAGSLPLMELSRILDLFAVLVAQDDVEPMSELLRCLQTEEAAWTSRWAGESPITPLCPAPKSLTKLYSQLLKFQIQEVGLVVAIKKQANAHGRDRGTYFSSDDCPAVAFARCTREAINVIDLMHKELTSTTVVFPIDALFVSTASAAVWLGQNLKGMSTSSFQDAVNSLRRLEYVCEENANSPQTMIGYTARLLRHLLKKASSIPALQSSLPESDMMAPATATITDATLSQAPVEPPLPPPPNVESELASVLDNNNSQFSLSEYLSASLNAPYWNKETDWSFFPDPPVGAGIHLTESTLDPSTQSSSFLANIGPPSSSAFPEDDDALWQSLFPWFHT